MKSFWHSFRYVAGNIFLLLVILGAYLLAELWDDFELGRSFSREDLSYPIIITDRHGEEIHRIFGAENREWVDLDDISNQLKTATIAAEDQRFYRHFGIDFIGIGRAVVNNLKSQGLREGASTLTQQIARKVYLSDEKTFQRKFREMAIAFGMESKLNKDEILEIYLNTVPYGPRINGVKLASQIYFQTKPSDLTMAQSIVLAALPKDPIRLSRQSSIGDWLGSCSELHNSQMQPCSPFDSVSYQSGRVEQLLMQVAEVEAWTDVKTQKIWAEMASIELGKIEQRWANDDFQHWQFFVRDYLKSKNFSFSDYPKGLVIQTSLDAQLQQKVYEYFRSGKTAELFEKHNADNFSLIVLDHQNRSPLVWIGSKYFWNENISGQVDMLRSRRQVGSTIKPFIYAGAVERGYEPPTLLSDTPIAFRSTPYRVNNYDGRFWGRMSMSTALNWSRNIPAVKALYLAGGEKKLRGYLDQVFGFDINQRYRKHSFGWSLALGAVPLRLMDLANAYATLATAQKEPICPILNIRDPQGKSIPNPCENQIPKHLNPKTSFFVTEILSNPKKRSGAWNALLTPKEYPNLAVKTGTASKRVGGRLFPSDNVVAGSSPSISAVLWAGNTDGRALNEGALALGSIGPLWRDAMKITLDQYPDKYAAFTLPSDLENDVIKYRGEWASRGYRDKENPELYAKEVFDYGSWLNNPNYTAPIVQEVPEEVSTPADGWNANNVRESQFSRNTSLIDRNRVRDHVLSRRSRW